MKKIVFFQGDDDTNNLYPFTLTKKVQDIRIGILTIKEKWEKSLRLKSVDTPVKLIKGNISSQAVEKIFLTPKDSIILIRASLLPTPTLLNHIKQLQKGQKIISADGIAVWNINPNTAVTQKQWPDIVVDDLLSIQYPWHIFQHNHTALLLDFKRLTKGRKSLPVHKSNSLINSKNIFIEQGAVVRHCIINADEGPVYIGKNALIMEGGCLRGPVSIGESAVVKMGAKIYGATTIGPRCTVGGEIKNSVLFAYSNKAHDGYLGDSVIGEWCNLGAGTSNSNLKNTAGNIDVHLQGKKLPAGKKCGVIMGDFSRTAINTGINSGTVIGVSANVFGSGLTPKHIPSFSWGHNHTIKYQLSKALEDARRWKNLKGEQLTEIEITNLKNIYKHLK
ncbi:MAG: putative sugar nucleotidyl transferase [Niabella sp.]